MKIYNPVIQKWQQMQIDTPTSQKGLIACPVFFDMHTHVRLLGQEDYNSLEKAAIAGGFGAVLVQPNTKPPIETKDIFKTHFELAKEKTVDYYWTCSFFGGLEPDGKKILCYSNDGMEYDTQKILQAFKCKKPDLLLDHSQFYEVGGIFYEGTPIKVAKRPVSSEAVSIFRNVMLGSEYGFKRFHIQHVTTRFSIETIQYLKRYAQISCEVTPHHLFFTMGDIKDTNFKVNPPLATEQDRQALLEAVKEDLIDVFATDHAPHDEKSSDFEKASYGTSGIEIAFSAFYTITGDLEKTIEKMTVAPKKVLGLETTFDLDSITVIDPKAEYTVDARNFHSKGKNCVFDGIKLKGKIVGVKLKGKWVYWDGEFFLDSQKNH